MPRVRGKPSNRELGLRGIAELTRHLREVAKVVSSIRGASAVGRHVQLPKIPPALSESLAILAIRERLLLADIGHIADVRFGGREADVIAIVNDGRFRIEVKSSGPQRFATFGKKDYAADFLIWFAFDDYFQREDANSVDAFVFPAPSQFLAEGWRPNRVTLGQLLAKWPDPQITQTKIFFALEGLKRILS